MKIPKVTIIWRPLWQKEKVIEVKELTNGYLIGETFIATEDKVVEILAKYVKNPEAKVDLPDYKSADK